MNKTADSLFDKTKKYDLKDWLSDSEEKKYAIPSFNFNDCWDLKAIVAAAEEENAPIFITSGAVALDTLGFENCAALGYIAKKNARVPVFLHLDHATDVMICKKAADMGYDAVMIDASSEPLRENIASIKEVTSYAHPKGIIVEGEIGRIRGKDIEGTYLGEDFLVNPLEAKQLAEESAVDMLAVGVGTQHGFYKGKPEINMKRLKEVDELVNVPLVLHGGTGIPEDDVREAIRRGIRKINVGTIIRYTYMQSMLREIQKQGAETPPGKIVQPVLNDIKAVAKEWIRVCMANGKA
jgi:ketose-bisphosphate aldolase